jgi:hypothetical protein
VAVVSDLASGRLAAELGLRGDSFLPFADGSVAGAENDADAVDSTFGSRQPPDARSGALRRTMLQALSDGTSALTGLRVAVRMGGRARVREALAGVGESLETFGDLQRELR